MLGEQLPGFTHMCNLVLFAITIDVTIQIDSA